MITVPKFPYLNRDVKVYFRDKYNFSKLKLRASLYLLISERGLKLVSRDQISNVRLVFSNAGRFLSAYD